MPVTSMKVTVEVHIAVASVRIEAAFAAAAGGLCVFQLPCGEGAATVTDCQATVGGKRFATMVVGADAHKPKPPEWAAAAAGFSGGDPGRYDPDTFRLPLPDVAAGDAVAVTVEYLQDLDYNDRGEYTIEVPLKIPEPLLGGRPVGQVVAIDAVINTGTEGAGWGCASHKLAVLSATPYRSVLRADPAQPQPNDALTLSYTAWGAAVKGSVIVEDPTKEDPWGAFLCFLSPPELHQAGAVYGRNAAFLLDCSGSMYGRPMEQAKAALAAGLQRLNANDYFAVCAFNHTQRWMALEGAAGGAGGPGAEEGPALKLNQPILYQANERNLALAAAWVAGVEAGGLTDIMGPLDAAAAALQARGDEEKAAGYWPRLPVAFLVTDGAVANEKEICRRAADRAFGDMRVFTFGIGPYANRYFLRMLAQQGRGYTDVCLYPDSLRRKMEKLMARTQAPVLTQITLGVAAQDVEVFPNPVPDLFVGAPLAVAGRFRGAFAPPLAVRGRLPDGQTTELQLQVFRKEEVPVKKVLAKLQLECLIASYWLAPPAEQTKLKSQVVETSVEHSIPCAFTQTVAYEAKPTEGDASTNQEGGKKRRGRILKSGKFPKGAAVGGVVVLGTAVGLAVAFGSVGGTLDNGLVGDAMDGIASLGAGAWAETSDFFQGLDFSCCGGFNDFCCFDIEGTFGACGAGLEGALDSCFGGCGDCCGDLGGNLSGCFGDVWSGIGGCFGGCSDGCGQCFGGDIGGCLGTVTSGLGEGCGSACAAIPTACSGTAAGCGDCLGGATASLGDFCGNCGDTLTCCGDLVGSGLGGLGDCLGGACGAMGGLLEGVVGCLSGGCECLADCDLSGLL